MRIAPIITLAAALALPAFAAFTDALDDLTDAVRQRQETVDGSTRQGRRAFRALVAAEEHLMRESASLGDDLRAVERGSKQIEKRFRDDAELMPLVDGAVDELEALALADRDRLADSWVTLNDKRLVRKLDKAVAGYDRASAKAARASRASKRARSLRSGWKKIAKTESKLGLGRQPDFALADTNPSSGEFGRTISPRDYLGKVSAYYFGHST